jgi:very-short-patch-repair endonuclease
MQEDGGLKMGSALYVKFCKAAGIPAPTPEYVFAKSIGRKWRFDYCWVDQKVALEVDGGIWTHGRHTRGAGWLKDAEKLNTAAAMGWRLLRCTPDQLASQEMLDLIKQALSQETAA